MLRAVASMGFEGLAKGMNRPAVCRIEIVLALVSGVFRSVLQRLVRRLRFLVDRSPAAKTLATGKPP
jgi:hypothetical protein